MDYDNADLLGGTALPVVRTQEASGLFTITNFKYLGCLLVAIWMIEFSQRSFRGWRETRYRLQKRRRHGIPDSDKRPFNVAYAAAVRVRQDREAEERAVRQEEQRVAKERADVSGGNAPQAGSLLKQRVIHENYPYAPMSMHDRRPVRSLDYETSGNESQHVQKSRPVDSLDFANRYNTRSAGEPARSGTQVHFQSQDRYADERLGPLVGERKKHALDDEEDLTEPSKKFRVEGDDLIDGDNEVGWDQITSASSRRTSVQKPQRGFKRQASPDDEDIVASSQKKSRDKRARKVSREKRIDGEEQGLVGTEDGDQVMDPDPVSRGKKRDRTEADSTFGGDESPGKKPRRRKRKSAAQDGLSVDSRGKKRQHDTERTPDSDEEEHIVRDKAGRKRGKRMVSDDDGESTDISMNGTRILKDPSCKGRKIGEEWEANGARWKVGPDGHRLRQTLVKKKRTRFSMPQDSEHPDSQAQMLVVVETWLTDDEFKVAEEHGELFSPPKEPDHEMPLATGDVEDSPSKAGKTLLWSSTRKSSVVPRKAFKDSIVTNVGLRINPFDQSQGGYGKRVASGHIGFMAPDSDSPRMRHSKSYSKWEKQDLEADSMAKLRKRLDEQKKASSPDTKATTFQLASSTSAPSIPTSFTVPSVSLGASTVPQAEPKKSATDLPTSAPTAGDTGSSDATSRPTPNPLHNTAAPSTSLFPATSTASSTNLLQSKPAGNFSFGTTDPVKANLSNVNADKNGSSTSIWGAAGPSKVSPSPFTGTFGQTTSGTPGASSSINNVFENQSKNPDVGPVTSAPSSGPNLIPQTGLSTQAPPAASAPPGSSSNMPSSNPFGLKATSGSSVAESSTPVSAFKFGTPTVGSSSGSVVPPTSVFGGSGDKGFAPSGGFKFGQTSTTGQSPSTGGPSFMANLTMPPVAPSTTTSSGNASIPAPGPFAFGSNTSNDSPFKKANDTSSAPGDPSKAAVTQGSTTGPTAPAQPKFNFGFAPKPTTTATSTPTADVSKGAPSSFKFNVSSPATQQPTASSSSTPKFSFGMGAPSSQPPSTAPASTLSSNVLGSGDSSTATPSTAAFKPSFTFGNTGGNPTATTTSKPSTSNAFTFGNLTKTGEAPKPLFGFGGGSSSPTTGQTSNVFGGGSSSNGGTNASPSNIFGSGFSSTTPAANSTAGEPEKKSDKPTFSFNFGAPTGGSK